LLSLALIASWLPQSFAPAWLAAAVRARELPLRLGRFPGTENCHNRQ
jgi:hypothetical protein